MKLNEKIGGARELVIGVCALAGAFLWWNSRDRAEPPPKASAAAVKPTLDLTRAIFTIDGAVSCSSDLIADKRTGHALQDASNALVSGLTGHDEKTLRALGCTAWNDGQPVEIAPGQSRDQGWLLSGDRSKIWAAYWLRNATAGAPTSPANIEHIQLSVAQTVSDPDKVAVMECQGARVYKDPQPAGHPPSPDECEAVLSAAEHRQVASLEVRHLVAQWHSFDSACRDGQATHSCENRDGVGAYLHKVGWCYGKQDQPMSDRKWEPC